MRGLIYSFKYFFMPIHPLFLSSYVISLGKDQLRWIQVTSDLNLLRNSFMIVWKKPTWSSKQLLCSSLIFWILFLWFLIGTIFWKHGVFLSPSWNNFVVHVELREFYVHLNFFFTWCFRSTGCQIQLSKGLLIIWLCLITSSCLFALFKDTRAKFFPNFI